jgi:hypothetical protein
LIISKIRKYNILKYILGLLESEILFNFGDRFCKNRIRDNIRWTLNHMKLFMIIIRITPNEIITGNEVITIIITILLKMS